MSKNAIVGVTVLLCVVAAGVGGFFATKMGSVQSAPAATTASTVPAQPVAAMDVPPSTSTATEGVIPDAPTPSASTLTEPASQAVVQTPAAAKSPVTKRPAVAKTAPAGRPAPAAPAAPTAPTAPVPPAADSSWTGLDKQWPSGAASAGATTADPPVAIAPPVEQQAAQLPATLTPPPPAEPALDQLEVEAEAVLGLKLDSTVNSETARVEDPVEARVSRDVRVGSLVAIPSGTRVLGVVSQVEKGGRMKNRARLGIRFHTLVLADGTRTTIQTDAIYREGEAPGQEAASKMGAAAAGGAILGAILGGSKGAAIGGSIGAAGGAAAVMAGERNAAIIKAGTSVTVRLARPVTVAVAR